jgi:hypothetical protein
VTPTTDTNEPGPSRTQADAQNSSSQAGDDAGHFGLALQAGVRPGAAGRHIHYGVIKVAIDLDHFSAVADQNAAPKCSSRSGPDRPPATANDIIHRAKTFSDLAATSYGLVRCPHTPAGLQEDISPAPLLAPTS